MGWLKRLFDAKEVAGGTQPPLPTLKRLDNVTVQRITAHLSAFKGAVAILQERPLIVSVRLQTISVDDDRLTLGGTVIRTPGLWSLPKDCWHVDSVWEFVSLRTRRWCSAFLHWYLYFDLDAVQTVTALAAQLSDIDAEWERCDTAQERRNFFIDYDSPLWQHYIALAPTLSRFDRMGNGHDRIFP
jgi:hypothetical protein